MSVTETPQTHGVVGTGAAQLVVTHEAHSSDGVRVAAQLSDLDPRQNSLEDFTRSCGSPRPCVCIALAVQSVLTTQNYLFAGVEFIHTDETVFRTSDEQALIRRHRHTRHRLKNSADVT